MVERVKQLGELERMLGEVRWLGRGNALVNDVRSLCRSQPQFPYFVGCLAGSNTSPDPRPTIGRLNLLTKFVGIETAFAENIGSAHSGILRVRTSLAFEAQRFLEVKCNHR